MRHERWITRLAVLLVLSAWLATPWGAGRPGQAQEAASPQVETGRQVYVRECARCHGPIGGTGQTAPALLSRDMAQRLTTFQTASALFTFLRFSMPQDKPGSLSEADYWAVLAFVLTHNGLLTTPAPLGPETADGLLLRR
ncbi:MAG: c-type cytochrome [Candidatus Tectimicrobiota bacterium]